MTESEREDNRIRVGGDVWVVVAVTVMAVVLVSVLVLGPFGLLGYLCGLLSTTLTGLLVFTGFVPLVLLGAFIRSVLVVDKHLKRCGNGRHFAIFWIALIVIPVSSFALAFGGVLPVVHSPFTHGFAGQMRTRTDVEAIRSWLGTLDPNDYLGPQRDPGGTPVLRSDRPRAIARLRPRYVRIQPDENGRPLVRLAWGGGFIGHYGLVVSDAALPTPPSDFSVYGEYRLPLKPGFYAWREWE